MPKRIDFNIIKAQISIQDIVQKLCVDLVQQGVYLQGNCPFPNHVGDRNSYSFSVHTGKDIYICPTHCGSGVGCIDFYCGLIGVDRNKNALKAAIALSTIFGISQGKKSVQMPLKQDLRIWNSKTELDIQNPIKNLHIDLKKDIPYLTQNKQLNLQTIQFFGIGKAMTGTLKDHIAIPMHNTNGQQIGYAGQNLQTQQWKFYFNKSIELFNYHRVKRENKDFVIVVEGFYSAMYLWQAGFLNVVALMGSRASTKQVQLITSLSKKVLLFLDNDKAGKEGTKQVKKLLKEKAYRLGTIIYPSEGSREKPIQFQRTELKAMISKALQII